MASPNHNGSSSSMVLEPSEHTKADVKAEVKSPKSPRSPTKSPRSPKSPSVSIPSASSSSSNGGASSPSNANAEPPSKRKRTAIEEDAKNVLTDVAYETSGDILRLLMRTKCEFFTPPNNIVFVCTREDRVVDVWKGLVKHNFLSVPVLQKTENKYYGFLDLADIVRHLVKHFSHSELKSTEEFWQGVHEEKEFGGLKVNDIMQYPLSRRNPFNPVRKGYSLLYAIEILAREVDCHRVPVITLPERQLLNMITQSQVVQFLYQNKHAIGTKMRKPISDCPALFKTVVSIHEDELAIDAFDKMVDNDVTGLAVLNTAGTLVGNLSLRDLKLVGYDVRMFWRFYQSVHQFLAKLRKEYQDRHNRPRHVVDVSPSDTLGNVLELLATHNIHRVYIVDNDKKPIGIVSLKDLLEQIINV